MAFTVHVLALVSAVMIYGVTGAEFSSELEKSLQMPESDIITRMKALFAIIDENKDGKISKDEVGAFRESGRKNDDTRQAEMEFKSLDTNSDGKVDLEEMKAAFSTADDTSHDVDTRFKLVDKDADGFLSLDEVFLLMNPAKIPELLELEINEVLQSQDKNKDGGIDFDEFVDSDTVTASEKSEFENEFKLYDTDGDGIVSRAEIEKVIKDSSSADDEASVVAFFGDLKGDEITEEYMLSNLAKFAVSFLTDNGEMLRFPDDYPHLELPFESVDLSNTSDEDPGDVEDNDEL